MEPIDTIETEYKGYTIRVNVFHDEDMGPPWEEHDGHGIVSDWINREYLESLQESSADFWELCSDRQSVRYYDAGETFKIAKRDGWGLGDNGKAELKARLGAKRLSRKQITLESVRRDFENLQAWCNDEWHWEGYQTEILKPDGTKLDVDHDSCWGYDSSDGSNYMVGEAQGNAESAIDRHIEATAKEQSESHLCACADIATV